MRSFSESDISRLREQVKHSGGLRLVAYRCTAGALTIGYGHNCDASPVDGVSRTGDRITWAEAESLLGSDLATSVWAVRSALPWVSSLTQPRQAVLYDMAFNMGLGWPPMPDKKGRGLLSFSSTLSLIKAGDYSRAARNMLASQWAAQVKSRANRLACQLETGEWQ